MNTKIKRFIALAILFAVAGLTQARAAQPVAADDDRAPELPAACQTLRVADGNAVAFHTYASGVQVYRWNGAAWAFVEPVANLFAARNFHGQVGTHYAGPTWESNSGSKVVARRVDGCTPSATAIPWLKLEAVSSEGPGVFDGVTFVQRVNTTGGTAPAAPGSFVGEEARVPYTAEYYFYRAAN
ncbi:MAG TPA: DUF3455 domain-containing protein [Pyrinomonadaceae bacterium]|jgi:hypothetical protein|nr:DUF3455 domain-containing protein [Pyrinomonadaceae bacterium]